MGSVQTKDINASHATPVKIQNQIPEHSLISTPIQKIAAAYHEDPRSPGGRRTPVQTPQLTPNLNKNTRERMMMKYNASKATDPRSPSMISRTPLHLSAADGVPRTPPPFRGCDPRSPCLIRTPLALSAQDVVIVPDLLVVGQELGESTKFAEEVVEERNGAEIDLDASVEIIAISTSVDASTASSPQTVNSSKISDGIMALVMSPLNSPSLGSRKRKDFTKSQVLSPLKKSYSAPVDENTPSSPINKSIYSAARGRAPLSPLSQRAMKSRQPHHCVGVQPIKFRMDPGILG